MNNLLLYSDGGCYQNGPFKGKGSWSFVLVSEDDILLSKKSSVIENSTNNRTEIISFIEGVRESIDLGATKIVAHSDSQYLVNIWNMWLSNWDRKNIVNQKCNSDLLTILTRLKHELSEKGISIELKWIKAHNGNKWNEYVDSLCTKNLNLAIENNRR